VQLADLKTSSEYIVTAE